MACAGWYFFGTVKIHTNQFIVPLLLVIANGTFLLKEAKPARLQKLYEFAKSQCALTPISFDPHELTTALRAEMPGTP